MSAEGGGGMEVVYPRCAGLDVHKNSVVAHVKVPEGSEARTFGTTTDAVLALADWPGKKGVTHVAMESTGVYWRPIYNVLEDAGDLELLVVNAQHIKAVPGRKTDVKDSEWICDLLRHGLLKASFIPSREQRERRDLVRYRTTLIRERADEVNRVQKMLETANIKLSSVATDIMGKSGRQMLEAMVAGVDDPAALAAMARGRLKDKHDALEEALVGLAGPHLRLLLKEQLGHIDELDRRINRLSEELEARLRPFEEALGRLDAIPGVARAIAQMILCEMGDDMSRFRTAAHLSAWAGLCPGNNESASKRKSGRSRRGDVWLKQALVEAAWGVVHTKDSYLGSMYHRIAARRGAKRAIVAVAHALLVIIYHMLRDGTDYQDLGRDYHDERSREAIARRLSRRLNALGYRITIEAAA